MENRQLPRKTALWTRSRFDAAADAVEMRGDMRALCCAVQVEGVTQEAACERFGWSRAWLAKKLKELRSADEHGVPDSWHQYTVRLPEQLLPKLQVLESEAKTYQHKPSTETEK